MGRLLSIDFGMRRIGLAVTDPLKIIATGLDTVENKEIIPYLKGYFDREEVERIILGLPVGLDDEDTDATAGVKVFRKKLEKNFPSIPIEYVDERYSSKMAFEAMIQGGLKKKKRRNKATIDKISAVVILQEYLEHHT